VHSLAFVPDAQNVAFLRIETHTPVFGPYLKICYILLQDCVVLFNLDVSVKETVISEQSNA
jgi:hypothetical protein